MYTKLLLQGAIVIKHIGQIIVASLPYQLTSIIASNCTYASGSTITPNIFQVESKKIYYFSKQNLEWK